VGLSSMTTDSPSVKSFLGNATVGRAYFSR
jgi:hypothetical protein